MINPQELPAEARMLLARIEAHLHEARPLLATAGENSDAFALSETQQRYLPETIALFLAVPPSQRDVMDAQGESAKTQLTASLAILEQATLAHLQSLAAAKRNAAEMNQQFLAQRFSGVAAVESVANMLPGDVAAEPSSYLIESLFRQASNEAAGDQQQLLSAIAAKFTEAFPRITRVERRLFSRAIKRVEIEVPSAKGGARYMLTATRYGFEATVATTVRGIALKTETLPTQRWIATVIDHLTEFTSKNQESESRLRELFGNA